MKISQAVMIEEFGGRTAVVWITKNPAINVIACEIEVFLQDYRITRRFGDTPSFGYRGIDDGEENGKENEKRIHVFLGFFPFSFFLRFISLVLCVFYNEEICLFVYSGNSQTKPQF